jgi:hypothetical protein
VVRRVALALVVVLGIGAAVAAALLTRHSRGYFGPVFAPDGASIFFVTRDVSGTVLGFGYEMWTPPARVWLHRDRFALVNIRLSDQHLTVVREFPPTPLEGGSFDAYHGAIFGDGRAHLRWADPSHLEYELAVTRHDTPLSRTFVMRRTWDPSRRAFIESASWQEGFAGMGGDEPSQLAGPLEVVAALGDEQLPCAVVVLDSRAGTAAALAETSVCRRKFPGGFTTALLAPASRRADIERAETIRRTYDDLVAEATAKGLPEGEAMLRANKEMERLGYFPKSPTLLATPGDCESGGPVFVVTDEEFVVGLFQDIQAAIDHPGEEVDKAMGSYVIHRDFDTSRRLNEFLADRSHTAFLVKARGGCWHVAVDWQRR